MELFCNHTLTTATAVNVSRQQILIRGLTNRCPNCGGKTLFKKGSLFEMNKECPVCRMRIEREEGFFLGALTLSYAVTLFCYMLPLAILSHRGLFGWTATIVLAGIGAIGIPILLYRPSRSWWLGFYYFFLPAHLPANQRPLAEGEDEHT